MSYITQILIIEYSIPKKSQQKSIALSFVLMKLTLIKTSMSYVCYILYKKTLI